MEQENFKGYERVWQATEKLPDPKLPLDLGAEWGRLKGRIDADAAGAGGRVVRLETRRGWLRYAAAAAVLAVAVAGAWLFFEQQTERLIAGNDLSKTELRLADGSHVFVNRSARLSYPGRFLGKTRQVELTGEAFFEVAKDAARPFIIETEVARVRVVGTRFNVKSTGDRCEVFVEEGHVVVEGNGQEANLRAGQAAVFFRDRAKFQPVQPRPNAAAWARGSLQFDNEPLHEVLEDLSNFYDVKISTQDARLQLRRFSSTRPIDGTLDDALEIVSTAVGARVEKISEKEFRLVKN